MISDLVEWEEPPTKSSEKWQEIADTLRANPERWGKFAMPSTAYITTIKTGRHKAFRPSGSFEARAHNGNLYARYVGAPNG